MRPQAGSPRIGLHPWGGKEQRPRSPAKTDIPTLEPLQAPEANVNQLERERTNGGGKTGVAAAAEGYESEYYGSASPRGEEFMEGARAAVV